MARHAKGKLRNGFSFLFSAMLVGAGLVSSPLVQAPAAMAAACPAGITLTPIHSSKLYWDKKGNDNITGAYLGYQVTNTSGADLSSVSVDTSLAATGNGDIKLGGGQPNSESLGTIPNGSSAMAYFLVDVKQGTGSINVTTTLNYNSTSCTVSETLTTPQRRALAANANKIYTAEVVAAVAGNTGSAPAAIKRGSYVTVVVTGNTGTIGSGPDANREINLTPVVYPGLFAADAWRLTKVAFNSASASCGASGLIENQLHISTATTPSSANCGGLYSAAFTFQSRNADEASVSQVQAFSYIASGNLIKHTSPFGSVIGLPVVNEANGVATTEPTVNLQSVLSNAISSGLVGFTLDENSLTTYQNTPVTSNALTFLGGTGPIASACLVNPSDNTQCGSSQAVNNLLDTEDYGNTAAGTFSLSNSGSEYFVTFTPTATYVTGSDLPTRVLVRATDSSGTVQTSEAFVNVTVVTGTPPAATGGNASGTTGTPTTVSGVLGSGTSITECLFTTLPMPDPCSDTTVSKEGTWVYDPSTDVVTFTPASGFAGTVTTYFGVRDNQGATDYDPITVTVTGPPVPTTVAASSVTATSATLNGTILTGYLQTDVEFCWHTSQDLANCTTVVPSSSPLAATSGSTPTAVSTAITGLSPNTTYEFLVRADNSASNMIDGSWLSFTTQALPPTATTTAVLNNNGTTVSLTGIVAAGTYDATPSFQISTSSAVDAQGALTPTVGPSGAGGLQIVPAGGTTNMSETWSGLTAGQTYHYQVVATPTSGSVVYGNVVSFTAGVAGVAPTATTLTVTGLDSTVATLRGEVNPGNVSTDVDFCWGTSLTLQGCTRVNADTASVSGGTTVAVNLALTGLTPGTDYYFEVIANNGIGGNVDNDVAGGIESFTTPAPPDITTVTPTGVTGEAATLKGKVKAKGNSTSSEFCWRKASSANETPDPNTFCNSGVDTQTVSAVTGNTEQDVSISLTNLEPNTTYVYQLKGGNAKGNAVGQIERFNTSAVPPVPVTAPAQSVTETSAVISGTVNPRNKEAQIRFCWGLAADLTGCTRVTPGTDRGNGNTAIAATLSLSSLTPGTTYYYRIIGNNGVGGLSSLSVSPQSFGSFSAFSSYSTGSKTSADFVILSSRALNDVEGSIENFTTLSSTATVAATTDAATSVTASSATLNGTIAAGTDTAAISFCYGTDVSLATCLGSPTATPATVTGNGTVSAAITGLQPSTTYYFRVIAAGTSNTANGTILSFTTSASAPAPTPLLAAVTSAASSVTATSATLNGSVNPGGQSTTVSFCYGTDAGLAGCQTIAAAQSPLTGSTASNVSVAVAGLTPGTTYYFRVIGSNAGQGTANGAILSFTTAVVPPVAPTAITGAASPISSDAATLNGRVSDGGAVTSVTFCFGTAADLSGCQTVSAAPASVTGSDNQVSASVSSLEPETTYYFRVIATNSVGTTNGSIRSFTTLATGAVPISPDPEVEGEPEEGVEPEDPATEPEAPVVEEEPVLTLELGEGFEAVELEITADGIVLPEPAELKPGYVFAGWLIDGVTYQPGEIIKSTLSLKATAIWNQEPSLISPNPGDESSTGETGEGELADTGFETSHWLVVALMMLAAGSSLLVYARRRA